MTQRIALITGASTGLGRALATELGEHGWQLVLDARGADELQAVGDELGAITVVGDVADPAHRDALVAAVRSGGRGLDLLVNNASTLGASPLPRLDAITAEQLDRLASVNLIAPILLTQALLPSLRTAGGIVLNLSSDAAIEPYEGWGGYDATKAALDHATAVLGEEEPAIACYAVDPGDMRTRMHADAFPGEDISDRPLPQTVVPALINLISTRPGNGRYRAADWQPAQAAIA